MANQGRPSKKTAAICHEIVERIASGEPLAQVCRDEGMPAWRTVYDWMDADADFSAAIARARDHGADLIALEALAIADCTDHDTRKDAQGNDVANNEWITRSRLRVETRLKLLAKWNPKKYGDRITHAGDENAPLRSLVQITPVDAKL